MIARFAWATLAYNVAVIAWGAYVRATGSGAGCGSHWPLCNGQVIPRAASIETLVEFSHRVTSGIALLAVVVLFFWVRRACAAGHPARAAAMLSLVFILAEAAVGAGLVLFQLVADNASMARALFMAVHLMNTFLLLGALTLTAHWVGGGSPIRVVARPGVLAGVIAAIVGLLLVGVSGAVAALGDTLFPMTTLQDALAADLSPTSHVLLRLRVLHPALAIGVALAIAGTMHRLPLATQDRRGRHAARTVTVLLLLQLAVGILNVILLAPVWLQMTHLLIADGVWIAFTIAAASALASPGAVVAARQPMHATSPLG